VSGVDINDFEINANGVSGTLSRVLPVGTKGTVYDVSVVSVSGNGSIGVNLISGSTGISDATGNPLPAGGFTTGQTYTIDQAPPTAVSINFQSPSTSTTSAASVTLRITFSERVTGVDATDFLITATGVSGSVSGVAAVGTTGSIYDVTISSVVGNGTLRLDLKASGTGISDAAGNPLSGGYSGGDTYTIDQPINAAPAVVSSIRQVPTAQQTNATSLIYRVSFSERVTGVDYSDFSLATISGNATGTIKKNAVIAVGTDGTTYDITVSSVTGTGEIRLELKSSGTGITDASGKPIAGGFSTGQTYIIDRGVPTLTSVSIASNNSSSTLAKVGDVITVSFSSSEVVNTPVVTIATHGVIPVSIGTNSYTASYTMTNSDAAGNVPFTVNFTDLAGNPGTQVSSTTNASSVIFDKTAPGVSSIIRQAPTTTATNLATVTFRVTFSERVSDVDISDFSLSTTSTVTGTIASVNAVGTAGTTYDVIINAISGDGTLRLDLKNTATGIVDASGNLIATGFTTGQVYTIDQTTPAVTSINRILPATEQTNATSVTYRVTFSEGVSGVTANDFSIVTTGATTGTISTVTLVNPSPIANSTYDVLVSSVNGNGTMRLDLKSSGTGISDAVGNAIAVGYTTGQVYTINQTVPTLTIVSISSNNSSSSLARPGDVITISFTASETLSTPTVTIATHTAIVTGSGSSFSASYTMTSNDVSGNVPFSISFRSASGTPGTSVSTTTDGSSVTFDKTAPVIVSIDRQVPTLETTNTTTVTFRATFSEPVSGVDGSDFTLTTISGATTGSVGSVSPQNSTTYDVIVNSVAGNGTIRLDLKNSGTGIIDPSGNTAPGFQTGQTYVIDQNPGTSNGFANMSALTSSTITASTGEKPQSKVWNYNGKFWSVLANSTGTYLWRLDGTNWTSILKLSTSTVSQADCKKVGGITHILLYQGVSSQLLSVEHVAASNTYQLWSGRNAAVPLTLDAGVETATIDIDGNNRMWIASAGVGDINVRWSDAPYDTWSAPITIATGVNDDDICDIVYMTALGKIGVLWSNQNSKRFGFRTHANGANPSTWTADEVPASQSAIDFGVGMADDHMNFALASDGTLYCAVKTSYDAAGYTKLALLVRRPNATWDNLYEVSQSGTRAIVILNESIGKLKVIYSSVEGGGNILYKESPVPAISFGSVKTLISGTYNDATSSKENYTSEIVILASNSTQAVGVLASDNVPTTVPAAPLLALPVDAATAIPTTTDLSWNAASGAATYQVQVSTSNDFSTIVSDQTGLTATSVSISGLNPATTYYWRALASNSIGNSSWSATWSFTTAGTPAAPLVGHWKMDESSGTTIVDASGLNNDGTTIGDPARTAGVRQQALVLNGTTQYATVPHSTSLNSTNAITLAAWVKPGKQGTQYLIKKAVLDGTDGYELSLGNDGKAFFRINQKTSLNNYRVNSTISYPITGATWMHIAGTYDGTVLKIYINGVEDATFTPAIPVAISSNTLALGIGAQPDGVNKLLGTIDDARVYTTALTASEIANLTLVPPGIPVLATPTDLSTNVLTSATLNWSAASGATSYQLQVSTTNNFESPIADETVLTGTSSPVSNLLNGTTYYWRVKANNTIGNSDWSTVWSFTTVSNNALVADWKMDEGSGTSLVDASGYANNGTTTGNPAWVIGANGQALKLNGTSQYATVPDNPSLNPGTAITLAAWIKPEQGATQNIIKKAITQTGTSAPSLVDGYELSLSSPTAAVPSKVFFRINQATASAAPISNSDFYRLNSVVNYPNDGSTWMHVAATYDGTTIRLYINGVENATKTVSTAINPNNLAVGIGAQPDGQFKFKGAIDDARIYNAVLSADEITALVGTPPPAIPSLDLPADASTGHPTSLTLSWNAAIWAANYQVQVSTSVDFATTFADQLNSSTSAQIDGMTAGTNYYWRVRAVNASGNSDWSNVRNFTTGSNLVGNWKMNEGSGSAITDASEYAHTGTIAGTPSWTTGVTGQALQLDGSTTYATVPNSAPLNPTSAITLAAWVQPSKTGTQYVIKKGIMGSSVTGTDGYELSLSSSGKVFFRINQATSGETYRVNSIASYPNDGNTWMHIAATYDGAMMRVYINGVENANLPAAVPIAANTLPVGIGAQSDGVSKLQGAIDDAAIYNTALSASAIAALVGTPPPAKPGLLAPADAAIDISTGPTLIWSEAAWAATYQVQVSTTADFATTVVDQNEISETSAPVSGLANYTLHYWRVRAVNTSGTGLWSVVRSFRTITNNVLVGNWKMEEGSGSTLVDASEYGNNGTIITSPTWATGASGQALMLNPGTTNTQYATAPNSLSLNPGTAITLAAWVKPAQASTQNIIKKAITQTSVLAPALVDGYELSLSAAGKVFFRMNQATSGDGYRLNSITSYPTDGSTWMHIAATYDGTSIKIYINGVLDATTSPALPPAIATNTLDLGIGAQPDGSTKLKGAIDEARVYKISLSADEVAALMVTPPPAMPVLSSPANAATVIPTTTTLSWSSTKWAATYQVQVSATADFATTISDQTVATTSASVTGLLNGTTYNWRVRAINPTGTGDWSSVWTFTTISNGPLVGYWKMDEGSGTTLNDASGYGNHGGNGTAVGTTALTWGSGQVGQALLLNGTSQYATVPNSASLNPSTAITLAAWVKPGKVGTQYVIKKGIMGTSTTGTNGYELSLSSGGLVFFRINQATSGDTYRVNSITSYSPNVTNGAWMHIAATYDGTALRIYINGILDNTMTPAASTTISGNTLAVGIGAQSDGVSKVQGSIDEARIYKTTLNASEIAGLAALPPVGARVPSPISALSQRMDISYQEELVAYPNPFAAKATVRFVLPVSGRYSLSLYDSKGILLRVLKQGNGTAGQTNTLSLDGNQLGKGMFLLKLEAGNKIKTVKVIRVE